MSPQTKTAPRAIEQGVAAEQSLLGALLLDNGARARIDVQLATDDFHSRDHRLIWTSIIALLDADQAADVITVFEHLQGRGSADASGGLAYLNDLAHSSPSAANAGRYAEIVRERAVARRAQAEALALFDRLDQPGDPRLALEAFVERVADLGTSSRPRAFVELDLSAVDGIDPPAQEWLWDGYVPAGHVTLFGGHGGAGKSTVALMLGCCAATGRQLFGRQTKGVNVLFYSAEDPADLMRARLARVCRTMGIRATDLLDRLRIVDATEGDPVLFAERRVEGRSYGQATAAHQDLGAYVAEHDIGLLIIDNASDVYDGDENARPLVRAFLRSTAQLVRDRGGAVMLLAHVDKSTSRAGRSSSNGEAYSGSTAWHNSARSRLFLVELEPGSLELQHQKSNLGPRLPPLALSWPHDGLPTLADEWAAGGAIGSMRDKLDTRAMLALIGEFYDRGEYVATALQSKNHAVAVLAAEKTYPKRKSAEAFSLLRDAERAGWLVRETYKTSDRKQRERWALTDAGRLHIGSAPGAPGAPSMELGAQRAPSTGAPAPGAPGGAPRGVWGEMERAPGAGLQVDTEVF